MQLHTNMNKLLKCEVNGTKSPGSKDAPLSQRDRVDLLSHYSSLKRSLSQLSCQDSMSKDGKTPSLVMRAAINSCKSPTMKAQGPNMKTSTVTTPKENQAIKGKPVYVMETTLSPTSKNKVLANNSNTKEIRASLTKSGSIQNEPPKSARGPGQSSSRASLAKSPTTHKAASKTHTQGYSKLHGAGSQKTFSGRKTENSMHASVTALNTQATSNQGTTKSSKGAKCQENFNYQFGYLADEIVKRGNRHSFLEVTNRGNIDESSLKSKMFNSQMNSQLLSAMISPRNANNNNTNNNQGNNGSTTNLSMTKDMNSMTSSIGSLFAKEKLKGVLTKGNPVNTKNMVGYDEAQRKLIHQLSENYLNNVSPKAGYASPSQTHNGSISQMQTQRTRVQETKEFANLQAIYQRTGEILKSHKAKEAKWVAEKSKYILEIDELSSRLATYEQILRKYLPETLVNNLLDHQFA